MAFRDTGRLSLFLLLAPFLLWILLLIVLPQLGMGLISFREKLGPGEYAFGLGNYGEFFGEPIYWRTLLRTATMSILVTALTLLVGFPVAWYIAKIAPPGAKGPYLHLESDSVRAAWMASVDGIVARERTRRLAAQGLAPDHGL